MAEHNGLYLSNTVTFEKQFKYSYSTLNVEHAFHSPVPIYKYPFIMTQPDWSGETALIFEASRGSRRVIGAAFLIGGT